MRGSIQIRNQIIFFLLESTDGEGLTMGCVQIDAVKANGQTIKIFEGSAN